jgi:hydroxyacylglutathione hydrolase
MRQSKAVHFEAPFIFLLFGNERALLLDTGATADPARFPLRSTVDRLVAEWLAEHPRESYELVVAHTHGHGDHKAGDRQFADRPQTTVVAPELDAVREFFGFAAWPGPNVAFDLGGRVLEIAAIPGHHPSPSRTWSRPGTRPPRWRRNRVFTGRAGSSSSTARARAPCPAMSCARSGHG